MGLKLGVVGAGQFSKCFNPLFQAHPYIEEVALAELLPDRREMFAKAFQLKRTFSSFEEQLRSDVDEDGIHRALNHDFNASLAEVHHRYRLPASYNGMPNGHLGSHQFLADDFAKAVHTNKLPPNHAWKAADYMAPGLIAHESAKRDGEMMDVPDFGSPSSRWSLLAPDCFVAEKE